ncbi:GAL3ST1 [Branchiostoma lanceolatum]|uniref:GAL3ST1 protein n=3 Tax=Branchiostoma lanceolatum TaxID=7740 RepID=A0A8K0ED83_BRALA|nr:GAL3ST1 [Branchiostoma lanceolatum]
MPQLDQHIGLARNHSNLWNMIVKSNIKNMTSSMMEAAQKSLETQHLAFNSENSVSTSRNKLQRINIGTCQPHLSVAFLKVHKCGSTTVSNDVMFRFAFKHNLIAALPNSDRPIIGSLGRIRDSDYKKPPKGKRWNIFAHHAMYNRTRFRQLMAPDTRYVTILREPLQRLKSAFQYFHLEDRFPGLQKQTPRGVAYVTTYLKRPGYWDTHYQQPPTPDGREHRCLRNCLGRDLGLSEKHYDNNTAVQEFIQGIENDFTTVLILEYLPESLVLLKRRMCWTLYDILYAHGTHSRKQRYKGKEVVTGAMKDGFYKHNKADVMLYTRFNDSLHRQISQEGTDFLEEVKHFKRTNDNVLGFCQSKKWRRQRNLIVEKSKWNDAFSVNVGNSFCKLYDKDRKYWHLKLKSAYGKKQRR